MSRSPESGTYFDCLMFSRDLSLEASLDRYHHSSEYAASKHFPLWLWPNVLSLDAPLVAIVWQFFFATCFDIRIGAGSLAFLGVGVWIVYASDRVLDGIRSNSSQETARHRFARLNRRRLAVLIGLAVPVVFWLFWRLSADWAFRAYLAVGVAMVAYFAIVHLAPAKLKRHWPKELVVGVLFAGGTCAPFLSASMVRSGRLPAIILFAAVLWINAVAIQCWEAGYEGRARLRLKPKLTGLTAYHLGGMAIVVGIAALCMFKLSGTSSTMRPLYAAIALTAGLLETQELTRGWLSCEALRVLADAALLTPLIFLTLAAG
ncbi:MAG: hypothetical protein ACREQ4_06460 [Candidatus Binataceae bacterium]